MRLDLQAENVEKLICVQITSNVLASLKPHNVFFSNIHLASSTIAVYFFPFEDLTSHTWL